MALGQPHEAGDDVFVFIYIPKTMFYMQPARVLRQVYQDYKINITGDAIQMPPTGSPKSKNVYDKGDEYALPLQRVRSKTYVKNVLKKYGKDLIKEILSGMLE